MICGKCNKYFSVRMKIGNKIHNLSSRKFCLDCSPFKKHNTKNLIKIITTTQKKCPRCQKTLDLINFYQTKKGRYSPYCKPCHKDQTLERQQKLKQEAVNYLGGKCIICSYDKYYGAMDFHHKNPDEKEFSISNCKCTSFKKIKKELDKCILVCTRCHRELTAGIIFLPS